MPPLFIFKGQRVQATWVCNPGPPGPWYTATDWSFMQGPVYLDFIRKFKEFIAERGLDDRKPQVLLLDGHVSHVTIDVLRYARDNNIHLFQLPSHSSHMTQPLDVCAFGMFKRQMTEALTAFPGKTGMRMAIKCDIASLVRDCWETAFTTANILTSFSCVGIFPVDKERAIDRLSGRGQGEDSAPGYPAGLAGGHSGRSPHRRDRAEGGGCSGKKEEEAAAKVAQAAAKAAKPAKRERAVATKMPRQNTSGRGAGSSDQGQGSGRGAARSRGAASGRGATRGRGASRGGRGGRPVVERGGSGGPGSSSPGVVVARGAGVVGEAVAF